MTRGPQSPRASSRRKAQLDLAEQQEADGCAGRAPAADADLAGASTPGAISLAAEALGRVRDGTVSIPPLLALLRHPEAVVQEGAIYGLSQHPTPEVRAALNAHRRDPSTHQVIREILDDVLEVVADGFRRGES
jgi:HEAT repeat protein